MWACVVALPLCTRLLMGMGMGMPPPVIWAGDVGVCSCIAAMYPAAAHPCMRATAVSRYPDVHCDHRQPAAITSAGKPPKPQCGFSNSVQLCSVACTAVQGRSRPQSGVEIEPQKLHLTKPSWLFRQHFGGGGFSSHRCFVATFGWLLAIFGDVRRP